MYLVDLTILLLSVFFPFSFTFTMILSFLSSVGMVLLSETSMSVGNMRLCSLLVIGVHCSQVKEDMERVDSVIGKKKF